MFFLNLSAAQFVGLLGSFGTLVAALYLLDRSRKKLVVSSFRFWNAVGRLPEAQRRRKMQEPWSLLLQLLGLLLLLLAIGQLQWGQRPHQVRNHVVLLDTSSATLTRLRNGTILDAEKDAVTSYLQRVPAADRVMLVRLNGLATPATLFTSDRAEIARALSESRSGFTAINTQRALALASELQRSAGGLAGELVYAGPLQASSDSEAAASAPGLRVLPVPVPGIRNCGIRQVNVHRDQDGTAIHAEAILKNYALAPAALTLVGKLDTTTLPPRKLTLLPGAESSVSYDLPINSTGSLNLALQNTDDFPWDNQVSVPIAAKRTVRLIAYTNRAKSWEPLLQPNHQLAITYVPPADYQPGTPADVIIFDQFVPDRLPAMPALLVDPPAQRSPLPVRATVTGQTLQGWNAADGLTTGLHAEDSRLAAAKVFELDGAATAVARVVAGPVVVEMVEKGTAARRALVGFDPLAAPFRFQVTSPLLVLNLLRWMVPDTFGTVQFQGASVGLTRIPLLPGESSDNLQITDDSGQATPYTVVDRTAELFLPKPGILRLHSPQREEQLALTLPQFAPSHWRPSPPAAEGLPANPVGGPQALDLWKALAIAAALLLSCEWWLFARRHRRGFLLKLAAVAAIVIALFVPPLVLQKSRVGVAALVDNSASISQTELDRASDYLREVRKREGRNWLGVVPFAAHPQIQGNSSDLPGLPVRPASAAEASGTNLEAALNTSVAAMPAGYLPRILLFTDGNENMGSTARAIIQLQRLQIPVDVKPLQEDASKRIELVSCALPAQAYANQSVPVDLSIESPEDTSAVIHLAGNGKDLAAVPVKLQRGANQLRVNARIQTSGVVALSVRADTDRFGSVQSTQAIQLKRPRVLYVSGDPPDTGSNLLQAFAGAQFDVTSAGVVSPSDLSNYQLIVLNNLDLNSIPTPTKASLERYVKDGGGLLLIGGEKQVYKDSKIRDILDRVLPADIAPPETPEGISVVLIIDKSSSMEGRKIELARSSASGVVDHLRPTDSIGVLMFDNSYQWAVTMRKATDRAYIKQLIAGITPDGGTQIAPALAEAYRQVLSSRGSYRHIVLLTDGISEEGDSMELARESLLHQVTISTVGLGQDVNRWYLEKVAAISGGRSYFLNQPQGLEQILLKDVRDYSGQTSVEKSLLPIVQEKAEILQGTGIEAAPPLKGYVRFTAKPETQTLLSINPDKKDPLYVRWQYGLGRAAVFTADAKARWAEAWVTWPGFDKFWINAARDLLAQSGQVEAHATWNSADSEVAVHYDLPPDEPVPQTAPPMFLLGPDGFVRKFSLQRTGERSFEGKAAAGSVHGLLRIRPIEDSTLFPEVGIYRGQPEEEHRGLNRQLLQQLASSTGGRYDPELSTVFDPGSRVLYSRWELWPLLLLIALVLNLVELIVRKLRGVVGLVSQLARAPRLARLVHGT